MKSKELLKAMGPFEVGLYFALWNKYETLANIWKDVFKVICLGIKLSRSEVVNINHNCQPHEI